MIRHIQEKREIVCDACEAVCDKEIVITLFELYPKTIYMASANITAMKKILLDIS